MRYYAVLDSAEPDVARNVFIVDDSADPVAMVVYDHAGSRWVSSTALIEFVAGPRARECAEIEAAQARELLDSWGAPMPDSGEVRALAEAEA